MSSFGIESRGPFYQVGLIPIIPAQISTTAAGYGRASPPTPCGSSFCYQPILFLSLKFTVFVGYIHFCCLHPPKIWCNYVTSPIVANYPNFDHGKTHQKKQSKSRVFHIHNIFFIWNQIHQNPRSFEIKRPGTRSSSQMCPSRIKKHINVDECWPCQKAKQKASTHIKALGLSPQVRPGPGAWR